MTYKEPCRFCNTVIDCNYYYCPYCGGKNPCKDGMAEETGQPLTIMKVKMNVMRIQNNNEEEK